MDAEIKVAMQQVVDFLDDLMQGNPSREIADCSNYLAELLTEDNNE